MVKEQSDSTSYAERVLPSAASLWSVILIIPVTYLTLLPFSDRIGAYTGVILGLVFCAAVLVSIWFASPMIEVSQDGFSVGEATLPLDVITGYEIVGKDQAFAERGYKLDPRAYIRFQLSVNTLIKLEVTDPADSTPYWLIATRNPEKISQVLLALAK